MIVVQPLVFQRNRELVSLDGGGARRQRLHVLLGQGDEQEAVFARIGMKNIGEGRRNNAAESVVGKRPGGMLPGGSAAEVFARDQNLRALVARVIENEIGMRRAGVRTLLNTPPIEEKEWAIAGAFDPLQELLGDCLLYTSRCV